MIDGPASLHVHLPTSNPSRRSVLEVKPGAASSAFLFNVPCPTPSLIKKKEALKGTLNLDVIPNNDYSVVTQTTSGALPSKRRSQCPTDEQLRISFMWEPVFCSTLPLTASTL